MYGWADTNIFATFILDNDNEEHTDDISDTTLGFEQKRFGLL